MANSCSAPLDDLLETLQVNVSLIAKCRVAKGWSMTNAALRSATVHFVLGGTGSIVINEEPVPLDSGCMVVVPPGCRYILGVEPVADRIPVVISACTTIDDGMLEMSAGDGPGMTTVCGEISASCGGAFSFFDFLARPVKVYPRDADKLGDIFDVIISEMGASSLGSRAATASLLTYCMIAAVRSELEQPSPSMGWLCGLKDRKLAPAVAAIFTDPSAQHTVDRLAKAVAMSRSAFSRHFSESFGLSPIEFLTAVRLRNAALLLCRTLLPVEAIAKAVGYASRSHFSRAFAKHFRVSPATYRKNMCASHPDANWADLIPAKNRSRSHSLWR